MTVAEALPNTEAISKEGLIGRTTPFILIDETIQYEFKKDLKVTIVEKPRSYQRCGRCVKFRVGNNPLELYAFWTNFKKHIQ